MRAVMTDALYSATLQALAALSTAADYADMDARYSAPASAQTLEARAKRLRAHHAALEAALYDGIRLAMREEEAAR